MDESAVLVKRLISFVLLPPGGPILLALLGLLLMRARPRLGRALAWIGLIAALLFCTRGVGYLIAAQVEGSLSALRSSALSAAQAGKDPPQAIVILGGGADFDLREASDPNTLSPISLQRVLHGVRLARASKLPILVTGGPGRGPNRRAEADLMADIIRHDFGLPVKWVESKSLDTAENAILSARMLQAEGIRNIVLVTHSLHMRRAQLTFEAAGFRVLPAPAAFSGSEGALLTWDWLPSAEGIVLSWMACHEWVGSVWYQLRRSTYNGAIPMLKKVQTP